MRPADCGGQFSYPRQDLHRANRFMCAMMNSELSSESRESSRNLLQKARLCKQRHRSRRFDDTVQVHGANALGCSCMTRFCARYSRG